VLAAERDSIPERLKWNLADLYPSEEAWGAAKNEIQSALAQAPALQGTLGKGAESLHRALDTWAGTRQKLDRLSAYASMRYDLDQRVGRSQQMNQEAQRLQHDFAAAFAWLQPEVLSLGADTVRRYASSYPALASYRQPLEDILRRGPHTLEPKAEKLVAQAGNMAGAGQNIRDIFVNADLPYPEVTLSTGEKVRLDAAAYTKYRQSASAQDRRAVFQAFWKKYGEFTRTLGTALQSQVQAHVFDKEVRGYASCVEAALFNDNIPVSVYTRLVDDVHANLPTLHRYLKLRQRMMGLSQLKYSDIYAPIVKEVDLHYTPEQAMELTLGALAPLGKPYVDTLGYGLTHGWVDWMPTTGKASGAYSTGAYGVHPYQLQNFTGLYDEVGTLAHESGHSMHTYIADRHQPYVNHDYATFVAEVASTLNENLLFHYMLDRTKDKPTRLFLLGSHLDDLRGTLFRQVQFAEFELKIHQLAEQGETLTGEKLSKLYLEIVRKYYGHDQHVCEVDPTIAYEWAYVDHFYYNFYVYQYATSMIASTALANGIRDEMKTTPGVTKRRDAYLAMLASGSSRYPIDLLKTAGVDMTTSAPFHAAMKEMNAVMDEIEKLLR
jgi:oligoendopeptidase F